MTEKIFNKIKSIFTWKHMPCVLYLGVIIWFHSAYVCTADDRDLIDNILKPTVWQEFSSVVHNFTSWSSRVLVNLPIHIMLHFDYRVWLVIELLLFVVIFKSLSYIFVRENKLANDYLLVLLLLMFPLTYAKTAGWVTTTMTYIWPIAFGCLACTTIRKVWEGGSFKWYDYLGFFLVTLYAANQEQMSVVLTVIFGVSCLVMLKEKKLSSMIVMQTILSVGNLFLHMLTPGNEVRSNTEAALRFPDFETLSLIDRLELGFSASLYEFYYYINLVMPFIVLLVALVVLVKTRKPFYLFIGFMPGVLWLVFGILFNNYMQNMMHSSGTIDESNYYELSSYYPMAAIFVMCIFLIAALYIAFGNTRKSVYAIALLFAGLGARMVVAFSPTIWASSARTFTVMYFVYIGLAALLVNELDFKRFGKLRYCMYFGMTVLVTVWVYLVSKGMGLI